jgi:hypothetical protein
MLAHLISLQDPEFEPEVESASPSAFTPVKKLDSNALVDAKVGTADFYASIGAVDDDELTGRIAEKESTEAFVAFAVGDEPARLAAAGALSLPQSVKASVAMLSQYQWNFVEQANELRSMAVSKIVRETDHPSANIRLRALQMLGNITEVALFTERVEVKKVDASTESIEALIREKLQKFAALSAPVAQEIEDVAFVDTPNSAETAQEGAKA